MIYCEHCGHPWQNDIAYDLLCNVHKPTIFHDGPWRITVDYNGLKSVSRCPGCFHRDQREKLADALRKLTERVMALEKEKP